MRFLGFAVAVMATFTTTRAASPVEEAAASYPQCALMCLATLVPKSVCSLTDMDCLCHNQDLNAQLAVCVGKGCTIMEALTTKNVSSTMCGEPIRDATSVAPLVGVIGGVLAFVVFVLRMCSSLPAKGRILGWDDWTIAAAMALTVPPTVFSVTLAQNGLGKDIWTLKLNQITSFLFYFYLGELFYFAAQTLIKVSLLLFLLRVFPSREFRWAIIGVCGLCVAYGIAFIFATAFQCTPVNYSWTQLDSNIKGQCNNVHVQAWMSAALNIVLDLVILVLPLKHLYQLQLPLKKKLMVMFMFSLGIFVTIVSAVRLHSLVYFANSQNITWDYLDAAYWSTVELDVGIICACLPMLRSLFIALGAKVLATTREQTKNSYGRSTDASKNTTLVEKAQSPPRSGDEGDFIPLVDVEIGASRLDDDSMRKYGHNQNEIRATTTITTNDNSSDEYLSYSRAQQQRSNNPWKVGGSLGKPSGIP